MNHQKVVSCVRCNRPIVLTEAVKMPKTAAYMDDPRPFYMCRLCAKEQDLI